MSQPTSSEGLSSVLDRLVNSSNSSVVRGEGNLDLAAQNNLADETIKSAKNTLSILVDQAKRQGLNVERLTRRLDALILGGGDLASKLELIDQAHFAALEARTALADKERTAPDREIEQALSPTSNNTPEQQNTDPLLAHKVAMGIAKTAAITLCGATIKIINNAATVLTPMFSAHAKTHANNQHVVTAATGAAAAMQAIPTILKAHIGKNTEDTMHLGADREFMDHYAHISSYEKICADHNVEISREARSELRMIRLGVQCALEVDRLRASALNRDTNPDVMMEEVMKLMGRFSQVRSESRPEVSGESVAIATPIQGNPNTAAKPEVAVEGAATLSKGNPSTDVHDADAQPLKGARGPAAPVAAR